MTSRPDCTPHFSLLHTVLELIYLMLKKEELQRQKIMICDHILGFDGKVHVVPDLCPEVFRTCVRTAEQDIRRPAIVRYLLLCITILIEAHFDNGFIS